MSAALKLAMLGSLIALISGIVTAGSGAPPGTAIDVPSDHKATYSVAEISKAPGGVIILTKRDGPSGTSYVRRECTCPVLRYRVLGEGESLSAAKAPREPAEDFAKLVYDKDLGMGSVSWHVCDFACKRAGAKAVP